MATLGVKTFELTKFGEQEAGYIFPYPEDASQSYKKGDPVVLEDGSGQVLLATDTAGFLGIAWQDASGVENTVRLVLVVTPQMVFSVSIAGAAGIAAVTAQANVGVRYSYVKSGVAGSTTKTVIDSSDTTNDNWEVIGLDPRDALGDTNGRLLVRAVPAKLIAVGA